MVLIKLNFFVWYVALTQVRSSLLACSLVSIIKVHLIIPSYVH